MGYNKVRDAIQDNNLSWKEIDRILLNPDSYEELQNRASFDVSDHYTSGAPAVRETDGQEKIVYVSKSGVEMTIEV
jgi:hypothetical protein